MLIWFNYTKKHNAQEYFVIFLNQRAKEKKQSDHFLSRTMNFYVYFLLCKTFYYNNWMVVDETRVPEQDLNEKLWMMLVIFPAEEM